MAKSPLSLDQSSLFFGGDKLSPSFFSAKNNQQINNQYLESIRVNQINQENITALQSQILSLRNEIYNLSTNLNQISTLISNDNILERQRLRQIEENERKISETKLRVSREDELEKKIQTAVAAPVEEASVKTQNLFSNIMKALKILFAGWLTVGAITLYKKYSDKNNNIFNDIGNAVNTGIGFALKGFNEISNGLKNAVDSILGIGNKISKIVYDKVVNPIQSFFSNLFGGDKDKDKDKDKNGSEKDQTSSEPSQNNSLTVNNILSNVGQIGSQWMNDLSSAIQNTPITQAFSGMGNILGDAWNGVSNFMGLNQTPTNEPQPQSLPQNPTDPSNPQQQSSTTPNNAIQGSAFDTAQLLSLKSLPNLITPFSLPPFSLSSDTKENKLTPEQISNNSTPAPSILPPTEPAPQVITIPRQSSPPPLSSPSLDMSATSLPDIKSSNPDNFYTLYSQLNYNVVM